MWGWTDQIRQYQQPDNVSPTYVGMDLYGTLDRFYINSKYPVG